MKVLIPEIITAYNKGEAAIFAGIVESFSLGSSPVDITMYSTDREYDERYYGSVAQIITESLLPFGIADKRTRMLTFIWRFVLHICFAFIMRLNQALALKLFSGSLWRHYAGTDVVVLGHDSAYSKYHNFLIIFCKLIRKPVVIYGASFCPYEYESYFAKTLTRFCLNLVDLITVREHYSAEFLKDLKVNQSLVHVTADKAFLLRPALALRGEEILRDEGVDLDRRPIIGFTAVRHSEVFRYGLRSIADLTKRHEFHVQMLAEIIDRIADEYGAQIVFIPHTIGPGQFADDRRVASDVFDLVKNKKAVHLMTGDYAADELKAVIGHLDFMIGERTHSIIGAASMNIPFIAISHPRDLRTYGIIGDMLDQKELLFNIENITASDFMSKFSHAWQMRDSIAARLASCIPEIKKRSLYNGVLFFNRLERGGSK